MRRFALPILLVLASSRPLSAQRIDEMRVAMYQASTHLTPAHSPTAFAVASQTAASTRSMVAGGLIGGAVGAFAGAIVGMSAENCQRSDDPFCGVAGGILGGLLGEAIGVPIGVNWVANGRGKLSRTIPVSIGVSAVCLLAGVGTYGASILLIPPMQIYTAIRTERSGS